MKKREKIAELLDALGKGHRLYRVHHSEETEELFIEYYKNSATLRCHGWASALGQPIDRIISILDDPHEWFPGPLMDKIEEKEVTIQELGFENEEELATLIGSVNLTPHNAVVKFQKWQHNDGTKHGLQELINELK